MRPALAWLLGHGLLGSSLLRALPQVSPEVELWPGLGRKLRWTEPQPLEEDLRESAAAFAAALALAPDREWAVLWAAGAGVVGTSEEALARETAALGLLLAELDRHGLAQRPGLLFLASSAGGVHGGDRALPITERSQPAPISAYGRAKLEQERQVTAFCSARPQVRCLIGRFSNLYGAGQDLSKPQGFISQLCRSALTGQPLHVFVPLDTVRDYLDAGDAAVAALRALRLLDGPGVRVKIIASERAVSLGFLLGIFARVLKRPMRVISARQARSALQATGLAFRSTALPVPPPATQLTEGIARVLAAQRALLRDGRLGKPQ